MVDVFQHQARSQQQSQWVGEAFARNIGSGAMDGLEDRGVGTDIGARRHAKPPNQACKLIGKNVTEQIGGHNDIELPWIHHQLHRAGIDDPVVHLDPPFEFLGDQLPAFQEQASQRFQDICLVNDGDLLAPMLLGIFKCISGNPHAFSAGVDPCEIATARGSSPTAMKCSKAT